MNESNIVMRMFERNLEDRRGKGSPLVDCYTVCANLDVGVILADFLYRKIMTSDFD